jgi:PAS domain S-box-containing protein
MVNGVSGYADAGDQEGCVPLLPGPTVPTAVLDALDAGVLLFDSTGAVTAGNRKALRLLALTGGELLGRDPVLRPRQLLTSGGTPWQDHDVPYLRATHEGSVRPEVRFGVVDGDEPVRWLAARYACPQAAEGAGPLGPAAAYVATLTDYTWRRHMETRLKVKKERLAATLDVSPSAILTFDGSGTISSCNLAAAGVLGYSEEEIVGQDVTSLIPEKHRQEHRKGLVHRDGSVEWHPRPGSREVFTRRQDGSVFPVMLSLKEFTANGERRIVGILDDLTSQKRAEEYLDGFFSESLDLLSITGLDGNFVRVNTAFNDLLGFTAEELMSRPSLSFVHEEDQDLVRQRMDGFVDGSQARDGTGPREDGSPFTPIEFRFVHKDGSARWVRWVTSISHDRKLFFGSGQDITAWRTDKEWLSRLAAVLEKTTDLVAITDSEGVLEYCNLTARKLLGLPEDHLAEKKISFTQYMPPEDRRRLLGTAIPTALREGSWSGETTVVGIEGREVPLSHVVLAHEEKRGVTGYLSMIARDISGAKEVERLKNEFVSTVSHELRTPLTSIRGSLGLLAGGVVGELPQEAMEMVTIAQGNTERLIRLINDILKLDKIALGHVELSVRRLRVYRVVNDALETVQGMAQDSGVEVRTRIPDPSLEFEADPDRTVQVLTNLLSNAIKFSPENSWVDLLEERHGTDRVLFRVTDQGPGIPEDKQGTLFERFVQVDSSATRSKGGSGLGLAICKGLVELHRGKIGLVRGKGRGSTFQFELPLRSPLRLAPDRTLGQEDGEAGRDPTRTAVIMTAPGPSYQLISHELERRGVHCRRARDLVSLCRLVQGLQHPLVVLDDRSHDEELVHNWEGLMDCLGNVPMLLLSEDSRSARLHLPPCWTRAQYGDDRLAKLVDELVSATPDRA